MKRISIKGKGVEAWFGEGSEGAAAPPTVEQYKVLASQNADQPASRPADQPAGKQASLPASKPAPSAFAPRPARDRLAEPVPGPTPRRLRELVRHEHPVAGTFRFTPDELDAVRDVSYELEVKRGLKVTRNDIVRLGLNNVIDDYRQRGDSSLLVEVFKEEGGRTE